MSGDLIERSASGPVAVLMLARPEARNALSRELMRRLRDELDAIAADREIRSVVLTGAGAVFCAGMDLKEAAADAESPEAEALALDSLRLLGEVCFRLKSSPKPVIAAVNGDALGGGAGLVLACDAAVASATARFGYPEVLWGLVPVQLMNDLISAVGDRRARLLLLGGRPIAAPIAQEWGLYKQVVADDCVAAARELGAQFAQGAPGAQATIKQLMEHQDARPRALRAGSVMGASIRTGEEAKEGVLAFREKRPPRWAPRDA